MYKAEIIPKSCPWISLEQVELATAKWADWWSHGPLYGVVSASQPAEFETLSYHQHEAADAA